MSTGQLPSLDTTPTTRAEPTLEGLQRQILEIHIENLKAQGADHENRIRDVETIGTRFNTLYAMFAGNGLMSVVILIKLFADSAP